MLIEGTPRGLIYCLYSFPVISLLSKSLIKALKKTQYKKTIHKFKIVTHKIENIRILVKFLTHIFKSKSNF